MAIAASVRVVVSVLATSITRANGDASQDCQGSNYEFVGCNEQVCAGLCEPIDCQFGPWEDWFYAGGCSGLFFRERELSRMNNECGKTCTGPKIESKSQSVHKCEVEVASCDYSSWSDWTLCVGDLEQSFRDRFITTQPRNGGAPCSGALRETRPCLADSVTPCEFQNWGDWTDCTASCGIGRHTRERKVKTQLIEGANPCRGVLLETDSCKLENCPKSDCKLSTWGDWSSCQTYNHQRIRTRKIEQKASGLGEPCNDALAETSACPSASAAIAMIAFTDWESWSECTRSCGGGMTTRKREFNNPETLPNGRTSESLAEVMPCNVLSCKTSDRACVMGHWEDWSDCSVDCGIGSRQRQRRIKTGAAGDAPGCTGPLVELGKCIVGDVDFVVEHHPSRPSAHESVAKIEHTTTLEVVASVTESQLPQLVPFALVTDSTTTTTQMVETETPAIQVAAQLKACEPFCDANRKSWYVKCHFAACANCNACSAPTTPRGSCEPLCAAAETWAETCDSPMCSSCAACQHIETSIERRLSKKSKEYSKKKIDTCRPVDCKWTEWLSWSVCTRSCGGGIKSRNRHIEHLAQYGGHECEALTKAEVATCNTDSCEDECKPGSWEAWGEWSSCSASCGSGYRSRRRSDHAGTHVCAIPPSGDREEFQACHETKSCLILRDCATSGWSDWSDCSCQCFGVTERTRSVLNVAIGDGARCSSSLRELRSCSPGENESVPANCESNQPVDCKMHKWTDWTECSRTCGGGTTERSRKIVSLPNNRGKPCPRELNIVKACNVHSCKNATCVDCAWGAWSNWSECSGCNGQRQRQRSIARMANECGKLCSTDSAKEVEPCKGTCIPETLCAWSPWSKLTCNKPCGNATSSQARSMAILPNAKAVKGDLILYSAKGESMGACNGVQQREVICSAATSCENECQPADCEFSEWSDWHSPTCLGLCERQRQIKQLNNKCGRPCESGAVIETKVCEAKCLAKEDCTFGSWTDWNGCIMKSDQRYRTRSFVVPKNKGATCNGPVEETMPCSDLTEEDICKFSDWSMFEHCSVTCGAGTMRRKRAVIQQNEVGNPLCEGILEEVHACEEKRCEDTDCEFDEWEEWSSCTLGDEKVRKRKFKTLSVGRGMACKGALEEYTSCTSGLVDCQLSEWSTWGECDRDCGGGQRWRQRQMHQFEEFGGKPCRGENGYLTQTGPCNEQQCGKGDCELNTWADWGPCSSTCGEGMQSRIRDYKRMRSENGIGCSDALGQFRLCSGTSCDAADKTEEVIDCAWDDWSDWSDCSLECNGGQRTRNRKIQTGEGSGVRCGQGCAASDQEEIAACNVFLCGACKPKDGLWSEWTSWSECSASCEGGQTFRTRSVRQMANRCGQPALGYDKEVKFCNLETSCIANEDCVFGEWADWEFCSSSCSGVRQRSRSIAHYGHGKGAFCVGPVKETGTCGTECDHAKVEAVDCAFEAWEDWTSCDVTCGPGQRFRIRNIKIPASNGGKQCAGDLRAIAECDRTPCDAGLAPIDCEIGDWQEWGACGKCGGQRKRFRQVKTYPMYGGANCDIEALEDVGPCDSHCDDLTQFCTWGDWDVWTECSRSCGQGQKGRKRALVLKDLPLGNSDGISLAETYESVAQELMPSELSHTQELVVAFGCGGASILIAFLLVRSVTASRNVERHSATLLESEEAIQ